MLEPIPEKKEIFNQFLQKRYEAEFAGARFWKGHRKWWLEEIGAGHEKTIFEFLKAVGCLISGWKNKLCLDFGCGSGPGLIALEILGAKVIGLEPEKAGSDLKLAKVRAAMYGIDRLALVGADGKKAPFKSGRFDVILSFSVVEHVLDLREYISEAYRLLRPGGVFILTTDNRFSLKEGHTGLYLAHWLHRDMFIKLANLKLHRPLDTELSVWPRSYRYYLHLAQKIGFHLKANRWDLYFAKNNCPVNRWKNLVARFCQRTHFPLESVLPGTTLIFEK